MNPCGLSKKEEMESLNTLTDYYSMDELLTEISEVLLNQTDGEEFVAKIASQVLSAKVKYVGKDMFSVQRKQ